MPPPLLYEQTTPPPVDLWVSNSGGDWVSRVEARTGVRTAIPHGEWGSGALAVDGLGNVYVPVGGLNGGVFRLGPTGGPPTNLTPGLQLMADEVAVDRGGNVYTLGRTVDDPDTYRALKIAPSGGSPPSPTLLWTLKFEEIGGQHPKAIAVDGASNAYILLDPPAVVRIPADGGPHSVTSLAGILPSEYGSGLAVDASGNNLYLSDGGTGLVVRAPVNGDPPVPLGYVGRSFSRIAVDAAGNVYGTDLWNDRVVMIRANSGRRVTVCSTNSPAGVAVQPIHIHIPHVPDLVRTIRLFREADVAGHGGIWLGNHFIPIPPRSPVMRLVLRAAAPYLDGAIEDAELGGQLSNLRLPEAPTQDRHLSKERT